MTMKFWKFLPLAFFLTTGVILVANYQSLSSGKNYHRFVFGKNLINSSSIIHNEHWCNRAGGFEHRVHQFNRAVDTVRKQVLDKRGDNGWQNISESGLQVVWGNYEDFFQKLWSYSNTHTIFLTWRGERLTGQPHKPLVESNRPNYLVGGYYPWIVSEPLCQWISTKKGTKARYDAVHNRNCSTNTSSAKYPTSLEPVVFNAKPVNRNHYWPNDGLSYPSWFYTEFPKFVFYIHIAEDVVITGNGDFITKNMKYVPYSCGVDLSTSPPAGYKSAPLYDEVFVINHYWGRGFFHGMLEDFPRMIPYLKLLRANPAIKIQVPANGKLTHQIFSILGLSATRAFTGVARAKVVYVPRPTTCGFPLVQESQLFSNVLKRYTEHNLSPQVRNRIILIRRGGHRHFSDRKGIEQMIRQLANESSLEFSLWVDNPVPPLEVGLRMFHEAVMVVAPHGAGLSNILFCQPGTYVIEGVCNRPHVNLCYQRTAHILGHRYHGIPSRGGCEEHIELTANDLKPILLIYLNQIKT